MEWKRSHLKSKNILVIVYWLILYDIGSYCTRCAVYMRRKFNSTPHSCMQQHFSSYNRLYLNKCKKETKRWVTGTVITLSIIELEGGIIPRAGRKSDNQAERQPGIERLIPAKETTKIFLPRSRLPCYSMI